MVYTRTERDMLVLIGGLLVVSFLYFVSVMKKDDAAAGVSQGEKLGSSKDDSQTSSADETNMECSQSIPKFVCSICGSKPLTYKIEERVEESTTYEIVEENNVENSYESSALHFNNNNSRRVPFPEAGVDIIDRKLKNTEESLEKEIDEYCSDDGDVLMYTESWTENWLFRKKDRADTSFKPVSMFVPNTSANYRAMIGERDVDEISDLSECSNDSDDLEEKDTTTTKTTTRRNAGDGQAKYIYDQRSRVLLDGVSKHHREYNVEQLPLAGNGYYNSNSSLAAAAAATSLNRQNRKTHNRPVETDVCGNNAREGKNASQETLNLAVLSGGIAVANENSSNGAECNRSYRAELFIETSDVNQNSLSDDKLSDTDFNLFSPPKPGTIADREHKKWQTAAPMENNPYSEENLQKRLMEKKYAPKYSSASSLLGITRMNGLDDGKAVDTSHVIMNDIDFETMDLLEKSSVNCDNTPTTESKNEEIVKSKSFDKSIVINFETMDLPDEKLNVNCNNTPIIDQDIIDRTSSEKSLVNSGIARVKQSMMRQDDTKNKSRKSKCTNSEETIRVTKKNATINEVDYSSSDSHDEKISLPSVKKLVEVFSKKQKPKEIIEPPKPKDNNTSDSELDRPKFKRVERPQQSPRPLHLHSLTARSLSKEFREGLR